MATATTDLAEHNGKLEDLGIVANFTGRIFTGEVSEKNTVLDLSILGKGLKMEDERKVNFTRKLATELLEMKEFPGERKLRNQQVILLHKEMVRGTFRPEMVRLVTCTCDEDDVKRRMNGQHCSWALFEMPEDFELQGKVNLAHYRAKTLEDMRQLYASIDRNAPRTRANVINSHLAGTEQFKGLVDTDIRRLSEGYSLYKWAEKHERKKHDGSDVAALIQGTKEQGGDAELVNHVIAYLSTFSISSLTWFQRASVIAAMFYTFGKAVKVSVEFWEGVREGTNLTKGDPRLRLRDGLRTCRVGIVGGAARLDRGNKSVNAEEVLHWCIHAWNAHRDGKPLTNLRAFLKSGRPKAK